MSVSPSSGSVLGQPFTWTVSSPSGYSNLSDIYALFNTAVSGVNACYIHYNRTSKLLYLADNSGANWLGGFVPGNSGTTGNSYCSIEASRSSVSASGTQLTLTVSATFQTPFSGAKNEYLFAQDNAGLNSGWQQVGAYTVTPPVGPITFQSNPSGLSIQVDGSPYTTPFTLTLLAGSHTVNASVAQSVPAGTRYNFQSWSDNDSAAHTVTTTASAATLTANFTTQYYLTTGTGSGGGGTVVPPSGWYDSGAAVAVGVTVNNGYLFSAFSGSLSGSATPQSLTMTGPASVTATFLPDFTISTLTGMATVAAGVTTPTPITVNVTGPAGSPVTVNFDAPPLPTGVVATFNPASITFTGSGSTTMSVTAPAGSGGYYGISARGTSGSLPPHSTAINLAVQDFTITSSPVRQFAGPNDTVQYAFAVSGLGGFNSAVTIVPASAGITGPIGYCSTASPGWSQQWAAGMVTLTLPLYHCSTGDNFTVTPTICGGNICHSSTVELDVVNTGTFSLTATQLTSSVPSGTSATFNITVGSANGFTGQVAFNQSTLPACATATLPFGVSAPGGAALVIGTANCVPGTYPLTIVGSSGSLPNVSVPVTLVVQGPAAPANITSPSTGSTLSGDAPTFTWNSGSQVTQYQLDLAASDDGTVCSPRYTAGTGNSASMSLAPCCRRRRPLTATLTSTFASGGSQALSYSYSCGTQSSYTVGGQVKTSDGTGLSGVTMSLSGSENQITATDSSGGYSFNVAGGGNYTVTPTLTAYVFSPPSQTFPLVAGDIGGGDFTAIARPAISGPSGANSVAFWYLGGAPSIDGYSVQQQVTLTTNSSNLSPTITWSTDSPARVSITSNSAGALLLSTGPSAFQAGYDVHVTVTVDGVQSLPFPVFINTPFTMTTSDFGEYCNSNGCGCSADGHAGWAGYANLVEHFVTDLLGAKFGPITLNESLENQQWLNATYAILTYPAATSWTANNWVTSRTAFQDEFSLCVLNPRQPLVPALGSYSPDGGTAVFNQTQKFLDRV